MPIDLQHRHLLAPLDLSREETLHLLDLAADLKGARAARRETRYLDGRRICLLFEKTSTRTRCAFEVAAFDQGAHVTYLDGQSSQLGHKESVADTARVLGRMYDGIGYRGFGQSVVEELAQHAGVPVWNGLTTEWHPTQLLADLLTMREHAGRPLEEIAFAFVGDVGGNMGATLLVGGALMGMDVRLVGPEARWPERSVVEQARALAATSGGRVTLTEDPGEGMPGARFVHTDVWLSMGEPPEAWAERIALLEPYRVDAAMLASTGRDDARFMHCLPAFHDTATKVGAQIAARHGVTEMEVTHDVFESAASIVFDQSENRLHTMKAVMVATLADAGDRGE
jgi:ornithine carbamoyltransferase